MTAIYSINDLGDDEANATADFARMNAELVRRAEGHFGGVVTVAEGPDEMNLLVRGNGYVDRSDEIGGFYESIICDESFYH